MKRGLIQARKMARKGSLIVGAIALTAAVAGCSGRKAGGVFALKHGIAPQQVQGLTGMSQRPAGERRRAELALVRSALATRSGILAPFRPARLGRKRCVIPRGGPSVKLLPGVCETHVVQRAGEHLVILSESWSARDFTGSGTRFRQPDSRRRLHSSWLITVSAKGTVRHTAIRGDFPPQLVF